MNASFSAKLFTTRIPILMDIGFSDVVIPKPQEFRYPTLLEMPSPILKGYTIETVIAEKLESIVKLALVNTRIKDFYDLWTLLRHHDIEKDRLKIAVEKVFANRGTSLKYPIAFTGAFYEAKETQQRWDNFLASMGRESIPLKDVIRELSESFEQLVPSLERLT